MGKPSICGRVIGVRGAGLALSAVVVIGSLAIPARPAGGPVDLPASTEPRGAVGKSLSGPGFVTSQGVFEPFERVRTRETIFSRDLYVAMPGFQGEIVPSSKGVKLTLHGNLPEMSDSHVLESAAILHDTSAFDLDFTLLRGRVVLTNTREKGEAKVWLRTEFAGVQLTLSEPGDSVAVELYGRWAPGVPFSLKRSDENVPLRLWDVYALKGKLDIKAGKNEWHMSAPPGRAYFHGDSVGGPSEDGPQPLKNLPAWADPKAPKLPVLKKVEGVVAAYKKVLEDREAAEVPAAALALAAKEKDRERAALIRRLVVFALAAMDDVQEVVNLLGSSRHDEVRKTAVIALRHWIGARGGRDEKLYHILIDDVGFTKAQSETLLQLLHSPFAADQAETYETLIRYLRHPKQAIRELAHWHLVRLAPLGRKIAFDASADQAERNKAAAAWKELIPPGELPKEPKDETKEKKDKGKKEEK